jgi:hypothetical protein
VVTTRALHVHARRAYARAVAMTVVHFDGGPLDGRTGEYDVDEETVVYDHRSGDPGAVYRRAGVLETPDGLAVVYTYVGPTLLS